MRIGIAFDLKPDAPRPAGAPDDYYEEFDCPVTIRAIAEALLSLGHTPVELGNGKPFLQALLNDPPEFVFNLAEGSGSGRNREARVPAVCEMLGIPYSGSDPLTLAVALDKDMTRRIVGDAGVTIPKGLVLPLPKGDYTGDFAEFPALLEELGSSGRAITKPVCEGSSKGIRNRCLIETPDQLGPTVVELWKNYGQAVLVEEFISGDEVTVGIVGNDPPRILGIMRVVPNTASDKFVYSLEVKRNWEELVTYECPAKLPRGVTEAVENLALAAYEALGCRDLCRMDFRIRDGVPYFIEANPLPGLNPISSDLILICKAMDFEYRDLIAEVLNAAMARQASGPA